MSPESIIPDSVVGLVSEPVGERSVLPLLLGQTLLHQKALVGTHLI